MQNLTSNQLYRGINRRFDRRAARLYRLGFRYISVELTEGNRGSRIARFVKGAGYGERSVLASIAQLAPNPVWNDHLRGLLRH